MSRLQFAAEIYGILILAVFLFFVFVYGLQTFYEIQDRRRNRKFAKEMKELTRDFL